MKRRREPRKPSVPSRWKTETQRIEADWLAHQAAADLGRILSNGKERAVAGAVNAVVVLHVPARRDAAGRMLSADLRVEERVDLLLLEFGMNRKCPKCRQKIPFTATRKQIGIYNVVLPDRKLLEAEVRAELRTMRTLAKLAGVREYGLIYRGVQVPTWLANKINKGGTPRLVQGT